MKKYEVVFILRADLSEVDNKVITVRFLDVITKLGGLVAKMERWGNRKLAYLIKKQSRGYYTLLHIIGDASVVRELERLFKIEEKVLRYITIVLQEDVSAAEMEEASRTDLGLDDTAVENATKIDEAPVASVGKTEAPAQG